MKPSAKKILDAMRRGMVLTPHSCLIVLDLSALTQRIGELKKNDSVEDEITSEFVTGKPYKKHYIKGALKFGDKGSELVHVRSHVRGHKPIAEETEPSLFGGD